MSGIDPVILALLACPACRAELSSAPPGEILQCTVCRAVYPVVEGIPRLISPPPTEGVERETTPEVPVP
jgi:uncharacterized protein YbaR (Trm112 family)